MPSADDALVLQVHPAVVDDTSAAAAATSSAGDGSSTAAASTAPPTGRKPPPLMRMQSDFSIFDDLVPDDASAASMEPLPPLALASDGAQADKAHKKVCSSIP